MNHRISILALPLALALAFAPGCDKGGDKKADDKKADDKKADDKKADDAKETAKAEDAHAGHEMGGEAGAKSEVAEVEAGGKIAVNVDAGGYHPAEIHAPPKSKVTLEFKRSTEAGCGQKLVIKSMELEKDLPLNEVVAIEVEVPETGEPGFACGMDMYKGKVVAKAS